MTSVCRLCLSSNILEDLFQLDGTTSLQFKIVSCININIHPNDGLPSMICKSCKNKINEFYSFKQECLQMDMKLQTDTDFFTNRINDDKNAATQTTDITELDTHNVLDLISETIVNTTFYSREPSMIIDSYTNCLLDLDTEKKKENDYGFQCEICGRLFKMKGALDNHLVIHTGLKAYTCNICSKRFCRAETLANHTRSHLGIKLYICEICGKPSSRRQDLIRHFKVHSNNKDYACPRCGRCFKHSSDVKSHMRTHTGVRPYGCKKCYKTYTSYSGLRKHFELHCKDDQMFE